MKLCKDCKHADVINFYGVSCKETATRDLVSGSAFYQSSRARRYNWNDSCGPEGKLWEKKLSIWNRLKGIFK